MTNELSVLALFMGFTRQLNACEIYRATMPLSFMSEKGNWRTGWMFVGELLALPEQERAKEFLEIIKGFHILLVPRAVAHDEFALKGLATIFSLAHAMNMRVIYEVDDDYTNQYRVVSSGDAIAVASMSDAITVTSNYLGTVMRSFTKRPTYALPNCIDPFVWRDTPSRRPADLEGKTVIGLTGSSTHQHDWAILEDVIPGILSQMDDVVFVIMGYHPEYLMGLSDTYYIAGKPYNEYAQVIRSCDIILAPVNDDPFNLGKSPIKAIEGQSARRILSTGENAGAAVIATKNPVYQLAIEDGKTGLLVEHTAEAWHKAIIGLLLNPQRLKDMQVKAHQSVYKRFDISQEWVRWDRAYRKILSNPPNSQSFPKLD